jgi:amidohydrolase
MPDISQLKSFAQAAIDRRRDWIVSVAKTVAGTPELGFREVATASLVSEKLAELGILHEKGIALTGLKGYLDGGSKGPTVAVIGELDSLRVPGHPDADPDSGAAHACGHHCQLGMLLGVAAALSQPEVLAALSGRVALMGLPAEEFTDVEYRWKLHKDGRLGLMGGKQEFIRLGAFDDVDMAMMVHTAASPHKTKFSAGGTSNGHLVKHVTFVGKAAHAGGSPHRGVNALQATLVALNALNAQRETFRDWDTIRMHGIITEGGAAANAIPAEVRYEGRVRGASLAAIDDANRKMDRSLRAGALALGAQVDIVTIPGYLPMLHDEGLMGVFRQNAEALVGRDAFTVHPEDRVKGGSTDMGDLSHIMPAIHPYTGGASGMGHGVDYTIVDYEQAVIRPAKAMAMAIIDLLADGAAQGREVLAKSSPSMTKDQYLSLQNSRLTEESYVGD